MQRLLGRAGALTTLISTLLVTAACGGGGGSGGPVAPPPPPPPPPPPASSPEIDVVEAFTGINLNAPLSMVQAPGDDMRWYAMQRNGTVLVFDNDPDVTTTEVFVDISDRVATAGEGGLLGIAFHPAFPSTPEVFLSYTSGSAGSLISNVSRFSLDAANPSVLDPGSEELLFFIPQPFDNHNGGDLAFGLDGFLYASFGDGGSGNDPQGNGQDTSNLLGTIVRIDVDLPGGGYDIPPDNPFAGSDPCDTGFNIATPCREIFAWGFRNPFRISIDRATGLLWVGDVGQSGWEEVDRVELGLNYGWNVREGAHCLPPNSSCDTTGLIDPVAEYANPDLGISVTGGYVYRGSAIPDLVGYYVYGDFGSGRIFAVEADAQPTQPAEVLFETSIGIVTFAEGIDGELYALSIGGTILQIVPPP